MDAPDGEIFLDRPPLAIVSALCRLRLHGTDVLAAKIDAYLKISSDYTVVTVCAQPPGAHRLLPRIMGSEPADMDPLLRRKLFADALVHSARRGNFEAFQWLVEVYLPSGKIRLAAIEAAKRGRLRILQWLHQNHRARVVWDYDALLDAASAGSNFELIKWLHGVSSTRPLDNAKRCMLGNAIGNGNLELAKWLFALHNNHDQYDIPSMTKNSYLVRIVRARDMDMIHWVYEHLNWSLAETHMSYALSSGHLELAKWIHARHGYTNVNGASLIEAGRRGDVEMIEWILKHLHIRGADHYYPSAIQSAAAAGHLEIVKRLHEQWQGLSSATVMDYAAQNGQLDVVAWLHEHRTEGCTTQAMDKAALYGHLDVIKWLHHNRSEGCTTRAMDDAAAKGHLEIVQWLDANRSEGCTTWAMNAAAASNQLGVVRWLHTNRHEGCTTWAMDDTAANGHLAVVQWLHEHRTEGCTTRAMDIAASNGHLEVVQWLHAHRTEGCSVKAINGAISNGHLHVAQWLYNHYPCCSEGCSGVAMQSAIKNGHDAVVKWLLKMRPKQKIGGSLNDLIQTGSLEVVMMLRKTDRVRSQWETRYIETAVSEQQFELLQFFIREFVTRHTEVLVIAERTTKDNFVRACVRDCLDEISNDLPA